MFDSRSKIVSMAQFVAQLAGPRAPKAIVLGSFDPFFDQHAQRLQALAAEQGQLAVIICPINAPLLDARARAELAASNANTNIITILAEGEAMPALPRQQHFDDRALHETWRQEMMQHVVERNSGHGASC